MPASSTTTNFNFNLTDFDKIPWGTEAHNNWHLVDALMARFLAVSNVQGVWENALSVSVGNRYIDRDSDTIYEVLVAHTTASTGLFAADRIANPTYWQAVSVDVVFKGTFTVGTSYLVNDFLVDANRYGVVAVSHTGAVSYDSEVAAGNIITLIDGSNIISSISTTTVSVGNPATASYVGSTGVLSLGIPVGATGDTGATGADFTADAELNAISGLTSASDRLPYFTGSGTASLATFTSTARSLLDDASTGDMLTTLGAQAADADILKADTADTLTAGYKLTTADNGTQTSGTLTPDPDDGNMQKAVNNGAHTLAPMANDSSVVIQYTNDSSAGTLTTSGFDIVTGDTLTTTNGDDFMLYLTVSGSFSHLHVTALQ